MPVPPIHTLPTELLVTLILQVLTTPPDDSINTTMRHRISQVDRRFRSLSVALPSIWSTITVTHRPGSLQLAKIYLIRARTSKLSLDVDFRTSASRSIARKVPKFVTSCGKKLASFRLAAAAISDLHSILSAADHARLESLTVWRIRVGFAEEAVSFSLPRMPKLRNLVFDGMNPVLPEPRLEHRGSNASGSSIHLLKTAYLARHTSDTQHLARFLRCHSGITSLRFDDILLIDNFPPDPIPNDPPHALSCPYLGSITCFNLAPSPLSNVLKYLEAPALHAVVLHEPGNDDIRWPIAWSDRGLRPLPSVQSLEICWYPERAKTGGVDSFPSVLPSTFPNITALTINAVSGTRYLQAWSVQVAISSSHDQIPWLKLRTLAICGRINSEVEYYELMEDIEDFEFSLARQRDGVFPLVINNETVGWSPRPSPLADIYQ